ncbi:SIS domain protein [Selenomonas sp. FOBRC6]|uniref:MurR/RpiR family transcriptional regulator n=1 Tax=Selenomonas sp. FOBRC6 TaxID=936572 RepID=UPI000277EAE9|nr:MurR/RpiR family transcriptional regulator [Selenomonas sp. FOBRC6]EJO23621.1 SIS domain protein [Selenomonas sp. FOBRC6]
MKILSRLDNPPFRVSKGDRKIINCIRTRLTDIPRMTIREIAQACGTAEATCTRFVRKMGFASLADFKAALAEEGAELGRYLDRGNIRNNESARETARKLLSANMIALEKTQDIIRNETIDACADLLIGAQRIAFIGLGYSGIIAQDSYFKFLRIGMNCIAPRDNHTMRMIAAIMEPGDVIFAISHSGETAEILETVDIARAHGLRIISLTENHPSSLRRVSDVSLTYIAEETPLETGSIASKMAQFFLVDLVYTEVLKILPPSAMEKKIRTTEAVRQMKL